VTEDEVPRADTTTEALAKLKPAFKADGIVTAGTASPLSDGASAIVVASAEAVSATASPRARIVASASAGVPPHIMGLGPSLDREGPRPQRLGSRTSTPSRSTRRSRPRSSRASAAGPRTPRSSAPTAVRSPWAIRSARRASARARLLRRLEDGDLERGLATLCIGGVGQEWRSPSSAFDSLRSPFPVTALSGSVFLLRTYVRMTN
jgi:hypothetical protein